MQAAAPFRAPVPCQECSRTHRGPGPVECRTNGCLWNVVRFSVSMIGQYALAVDSDSDFKVDLITCLVSTGVVSRLSGDAAGVK